MFCDKISASSYSIYRLDWMENYLIPGAIVWKKPVVDADDVFLFREGNLEN
jgi:hypothetical protein